MVREHVDIPRQLDDWIGRCERYEEAGVRRDLVVFLSSDEADELPLSVLAALNRAVNTTDRILTALSILAALDSFTLPRSGEDRAG
jgi:hypothetical protein